MVGHGKTVIESDGLAILMDRSVELTLLLKQQSRRKVRFGEDLRRLFIGSVDDFGVLNLSHVAAVLAYDLELRLCTAGGTERRRGQQDSFRNVSHH